MSFTASGHGSREVQKRGILAFPIGIIKKMNEKKKKKKKTKKKKLPASLF